MKKQGMELEVFATNCAGEPPLGLVGVQVHALSPAPKGELALREQKCLAANDSLRTALECHGPFDLVYERYSLWSFAGMEYARTMSTPALLEINAPLIEEQAEHRGLIDSANAQRVARLVFSAATALLAVSDGVAEYLEAFPEAHGKIHVVANGVNPDHFPPEQKASLPATDRKFTIGFVGSMKPWHGLAGLLDAFTQLHQRFPETRLLMVGDGAGRDQLAQEANSRGLANSVHFTGAVAPSEVPGLLASMDVAVAPYPKLTNFYFSPLKVYEYMAAGLPVIASRAGQIQQLIESEMTGLLVPPGDVPALTAAMERLRCDPALRRRLGSAGRAKVLRDHTWDAAVHRILHLAGVDSPTHATESK